MPVAELKRGQTVQVERASQRRELRGAPAEVLIPAIIDPTPALATYRLHTLFGPRFTNSKNSMGVIEGVAHCTLLRVLDYMQEVHPRRSSWTTAVRLGDLSREQRELLINALLNPPSRRTSKRPRIAKGREPEWLDGPSLVEWLQAKGVDQPDLQLDGMARRFRDWKKGSKANVFSVDRVLTKLGLHLSELPDELWLAPETTRATT